MSIAFATRQVTTDVTRAELREIVEHPDAMVANRRITQAHHDLGRLLAGALGEDTGPNFHTWAVWGSREAGTTIGRRDVTGLCSWVALAGGAGGAVLAGLASASAAWVAAVAVVVGVTSALVTSAFLRRAARHISHGNRIVLDEIGGVTLDYLTLVDIGSPDPLGALLPTLEPGPTDDGGQDLLRRAFAAYDAARTEPDRARRHQLTFAANCFAVKHEHLRLQHDISRALPWALRGLLTRRLLDFWVGDEHLHVARDLTPFEPGDDAFPETLRDLVVPQAQEAVAELRDPARPAATLAGSGAPDWSVLAHRMDYVVDLFRSRHTAPGVWSAPY